MSPQEKETRYAEVRRHIDALIAGETDEIAILSTVVCELHRSFEYFDWTGFYRVTEPRVLKVGPYQGGHGCLVIAFERGVCGKCAREGKTQLVPDVRELPYHIACASSTLAEIVVPVLGRDGGVRAVLDVDSDTLAAFDTVDQRHLEALCGRLSALYPQD